MDSPFLGSPAGERRKTPMRMELTKDNILELLNHYRGEELFVGSIPKNAEITTKVPSGGDYSGMTLEFDDDKQVLKITWEE